ncbi:MAG: 50S ribosomal protein L10 [Nitrospinota bacterium]|nr:50S ribosomal protein L10 [Nitrospinota bacterium]MDH5677533.1 50S ribosomal protein L10 [Nitrospinota bacterium]MDH5756241.1 50S ribosomal protein L10 [Nitrospinota bacterium]
MVTEAKKVEVEKLQELFKKSRCALIAEYNGVTAVDMTALRQGLRGAESQLKVTKNTLAKLAIKDTSFEGAGSMLAGPVSIIFSFGDDVSKPAKMLLDFAKTHDTMKVVGGVLEGSTLGPNDVKKLATLPPKPVVQGMLLGLLQAPARNFVGLLVAVPRKMLYALNAIADKKQAG